MLSMREPGWLPNHRRRRDLRTYTLVLLVVGFFVFPFVWMLSVALKQPQELFTFPPYIMPHRPTLQNFETALSPAFLRYAINSTLVALMTTVVTITTAIFSAYSFSRLHFPGRKTLLVLIIMTQLLPLSVLVVPMHRIMVQLGLIDTYPALVIAYLAFTVPVAVWFLRGFFTAIPYEMEEAAMIDGCTRLQAFVRVVLPLSLPGISATASYVFFVSWQEFMFALAFTNRREMRTLPVGVLDFIGEHSTDWGALMAACILVCVPVFVIFLFIQQQFIAGLTKGALKG